MTAEATESFVRRVLPVCVTHCTRSSVDDTYSYFVSRQPAGSDTPVHEPAGEYCDFSRLQLARQDSRAVL